MIAWMRVVTAATLATVVAIAAGESSAIADNPCSMEAIFTYAPGPTLGFTFGSGQEAILSKVDNSLVATCSGVVNWNAQTVNSSFNGSDYVEAGWVEGADNSLKFFSEQMKNGVDTFNVPIYVCSGQTTGSGTFGFKVEHQGFGVWASYVDCTGGETSWTQFGPLLPAGFGTAVPRGEFEKYDHLNSVNMFQSSMKYKSGSTWFAWPGVACWGDGMQGYQMAPFGGSSWFIAAGNYAGSCANGQNTP